MASGNTNSTFLQWHNRLTRSGITGAELRPTLFTCVCAPEMMIYRLWSLSEIATPTPTCALQHTGWYPGQPDNRKTLPILGWLTYADGEEKPTVLPCFTSCL